MAPLANYRSGGERGSPGLTASSRPLVGALVENKGPLFFDIKRRFMGGRLWVVKANGEVYWDSIFIQTVDIGWSNSKTVLSTSIGN